MMGMFGLAVLITGTFAVSGIASWRAAAWVTGIATGYFGLMSISFANQVGTAGTLWGSLALIWAIVFMAVAEYSRRGNVSGLFNRSNDGPSDAPMPA